MKNTTVGSVLMIVAAMLASSSCSEQASESKVRAAADMQLDQYCCERPETYRETKYVSTSQSKGNWLVEHRSDSHQLAIIVHPDLSTEVSTLAEPR